MILHAATLDRDKTHDLLKAVVAPRPIAWVSTINEAGDTNAAPFSCFTFVSIHPPMLAISIERRNGQKKDTLVNIETTRQFVVNIASQDMAERVNATAADYPYGVSEIEAAGLTSAPAEIVTAPRIAECPVHMECRLEQVIELTDSDNTLVIGRVLVFHVQNRLLHEGQVDVIKLAPLARLSGDRYCGLGKALELPRTPHTDAPIHRHASC